MADCAAILRAYKYNPLARHNRFQLHNSIQYSTEYSDEKIWHL